MSLLWVVLAVIEYLLISLLVLSPGLVVECFLWVVLEAFCCVFSELVSSVCEMF